MDKPQDVYAAVAAIVKPLVERDAAEGEVAAIQWLQHGIDRKVAKRATMTFVYGSKMRGFSKQLETDLVDTEKGREIFGTEWEAQSVACNYMAKHIDTAVKQTVKAAAEGMSWLQQVATIMGGQDLPVRWTTPLGLPVTNAYFKKETKRVNSMLWDRDLNVPVRFAPKVAIGNAKDMDRSKQRNGVAPNFVHSMDASHLMSVVLKASDDGINDFLLIHDSFASLPNDAGRFGEIIREAFVGLYAENEPLEEIMHSAIEDLMVKFEAADADDQADITKALKKLRKLGMPSKGTLDLNGVLKSQYAFA
jgi:DNA-directed RNA polymerase